MGMLLFVMTGGVLLAAAIILREWQGARERKEARNIVRTLEESLERQQRTLRRLQEDVFVLQSVLRERNLLSDQELAHARDRLVDQPKRVAAERDAIQRHLKIGVATQVIEDTLNKVH